jgi:Flp pilus assembly pilin Flp
MFENNLVLHSFIFDESGQGITEYGAILAFVAVLIVVVTGFVKGPLAGALNNCYSVIVYALNTLCAAS